MKKLTFHGWKKGLFFAVTMGLVFLGIGKKCHAQKLIEKGEKPSYQVLLDSLVHTFSAEDLLKFREYYENEVSRLKAEKKLLRQKNIQEVEKLLSENPNAHFVDKILLRLGEFYYEQAEDDFLAKMDAYDKAYNAYEAGKRSTPPEEPKIDYSKAIREFQLVVDNFPDSDLYDDALYNLAYLLSKKGENVEAVGYFQEIATKFPKSKYAPEALMQIGEYYFNPPVRNYDEALKYYRLVLRYKDTPRYDEALYKIGWANYLKGNYTDAIASFTTLVQDIEKVKSVDYTGTYSNPSLENESLDYIGICFHDDGGLDNAIAYLADLHYPDYGVRILKKLGDVYKQNEEKFLRAIDVYSMILEKYPDSPEGPQIENEIVDSYRHLEDQRGMFEAQHDMFRRFHPGSAWSQAIEKKVADPLIRRKILREASDLVKKNLRENINLLLTEAQKDSSLDYYTQAVDNSRIYLNSFPDDSLAYTIHWNMAVVLDAKLNRDEEAFKEYEKIAFDYAQDKYRKDAAKNAIAVANEILQKHQAALGKTAAQDSNTIRDFQKLATQEQKGEHLQPVSQDTLSADELRLVEAYNNFIKLFPNDKETPVSLANAGILFYNRRHFDEALKYFTTLIRRFPDSPQLSQAQFTAMESYFGKHDFVNAEQMAKKIQEQPNAPVEVKKKARRRMAESIFMHGRTLAEKGDHLEAAKEYRRVVKEVPDATFADLALFQSALEYDKVSEFSRAVEAYQYLIDHFPKSKYYLDAMNNLALDYGELKDYAYASATYERLWKATPDSAKAQDALYNASFFAVKAKDWKNAVRINRLYVDKYPKAPDAENMFFDMAGYYLKLDNLTEANKIWDEFARRYPDSPRSVETFYKRGEYFMNKGEHALAMAEFDKAIRRNDQLKQKGLKTNDFYAAEALFKKSELMYQEYAGIHFTLTDFKAQQARKKDLLKKLVTQYEQVAAFGTIRLYQATYDIGKVYENFAGTWNSQEIPPMSKTKQIVYLNRVHGTSAKLYDKAHEAYRSAVVALRKLAEKYQPSVPDTTAPDTTGKKSIRVTEEDSTLRVAKKWIARSAEKSSEMLYRIADLNSASVAQILNAPLPDGLDPVAMLEYKNQVYLKAVKPIVDNIVQAHLRNLNEADSLQLDNIWVEQSRKKLMEVFGILPAQYFRLTKEALGTYEAMNRKYTRIMKSGTEQEKENALSLAGDLLNVIELGKKYAQIMGRFYQWEMDNILSHHFADRYRNKALDGFLQNAVLLSTQFKVESDSARAMKDTYSALNQKDPQPEYEDAIYTYSDNASSLHDAALQVAADAYAYKKQHNLQSLAVGGLSALLVELDPLTYAKEFRVETDSVYVLADSTWLVSERADSNWFAPDFPDSDWQHAARLTWDSTGTKIFPKEMAYSVGLPVPADSSLRNVAVSDSDSVSVAADSTADPAPGDPSPTDLYFRKIFTVSDLPVAADLKIQADDNVKIFMNGVKVFSEESDTLGWKQVFPVNVNDFIKTGKNVVAIHVWDTDSTGKGMRAGFQIQLLRKQSIEKVSREVQQQEKNFDAELAKQTFLLNRVPKP